MMGRHAKETRKCQVCKQDRPKDAFYSNGKTLANVCKSCNTNDVLMRSYKRMGAERLELHIQRLERQYFMALRAAQELEK